MGCVKIVCRKPVQLLDNDMSKGVYRVLVVAVSFYSTVLAHGFL